MLQPDLHIGQIIRNEIHRQGISIVELSNQLHCSRQRLYDIFGRSVVDTQTLWQLSLALHTDFFHPFSIALGHAGDAPARAI